MEFNKFVNSTFTTYNYVLPDFCCETKLVTLFYFNYQSIKIVEIDITLTIKIKIRSIESYDNNTYI